MATPQYKAGDWVIYRVQKRSVSPGPRAVDVFPAPHGDAYSYLVDKFWVVEEIMSDGRLRLATRRGKQHEIEVPHPRLRRARWWEKWLYAARFRAVEQSMAKFRMQEVEKKGEVGEVPPQESAL